MGSLVTRAPALRIFPGQLINFLRSVDHDPDGEADASAAQVWFGVPVAGELSEGKQRDDDATQFESRELVVVDDLRPAEVAVEAPEAGKVTCAERDHHVGQGCGCAHDGSICQVSDIGPALSPKTPPSNQCKPVNLSAELPLWPPGRICMSPSADPNPAGADAMKAGA
jgi:hypothetical protein